MDNEAHDGRVIESKHLSPLTLHHTHVLVRDQDAINTSVPASHNIH